MSNENAGALSSTDSEESEEATDDADDVATTEVDAQDLLVLVRRQHELIENQTESIDERGDLVEPAKERIEELEAENQTLRDILAIQDSPAAVTHLGGEEE